MTWRRHVVAEAETLSDAEVWTYDLGTRGILSGIILEIEATNGSTSNTDNHVHDCVKKIELTDGARKLLSVTGVQAQALAWADTGRCPPDVIDENADQVQKAVFPIWFGRYPGDTEYFIDLSRLSNPKIEVDWDIANVKSTGATGFVSGSGKITCILIKDDIGPFPTAKGYFRKIEQYKWTTAASGDERVKLPVDFPWRRIMLRAYESGVAMTSSVTDWKLSMDNDKFIFAEEKINRTLDLNIMEVGSLPQVEQRILKANDETFESNIADPLSVQLISEYDARNVDVTSTTGGKITISLYDLATPTADTTARPIKALVKGRGYHNCVFMNFEKLGFFPAPSYGKGDLIVTQGNAGAAASVVLEEVATI